MYILATDETNLHPSESAKFFVYGGLFLPLASLPALSSRIAAVRREAGYQPDDEFKFDTRTRPAAVSIASATQAKRETVRACIDAGAKFIACVVHHAIRKNRPEGEGVGWAANHVIGRFNKFLSENGAYGICLVDRLPIEGDYRYLTDKFVRGLDLDGGGYVPLDRICAFGSTCIGASHLSSAVDIVLGSFRYCINQPKNRDAAREMLAAVATLMWGIEIGESKYLRERGLILRPRKVTVPQYRQDYDDLVRSLVGLLEENPEHA